MQRSNMNVLKEPPSNGYKKINGEDHTDPTKRKKKKKKGAKEGHITFSKVLACSGASHI